jgi:hypothetical protein
MIDFTAAYFVFIRLLLVNVWFVTTPAASELQSAKMRRLRTKRFVISRRKP